MKIIILNAVLDSMGVVLISAVLISVSYFLFKQIKKDFLKAKEEKNAHIEGILNRSEIHSVISAYMNRVGSEGSFSLIYLDLDKFENFVNAFGERETKRILEVIAKRLKGVLPIHARIARYQGDEFLIFLNNEFDRIQVLDMAKELLEVMREKIDLMIGSEIEQTASISVAFYPQHGKSIKSLMESLRIANYQIKKQGGNMVKIYSDDMEEKDEFVEYFYEIKNAIQHKQFKFYFQPIVNVRTNETYAFEALIRWEHPELGVLGPNKFIHIMEQSGDIHWVGWWGIETIIRSYEKFKEHTNKPLKLTLNLSPKQLISDSLIQDVQKVIKKYKLPANQIILEVIEYALFDKQEMIINNLIKLKKLGFQIAVDGFGLDLANLARLEKIDVDMIKIGYQDLDTDSYVKTKFFDLLVDFASKHEVALVCENVETQTMVETLKTLPFNYGQGFYYEAALPFEEALDFLNQTKRSKLEEDLIETRKQEEEKIEKLEEKVTPEETK